MRKLKILELCPYSAGGCGVWQRVKQESLELKKLGHEIKIFSSNFEKGTDRIVDDKDNLGTIPIKRFPAKKLGGESFLVWNFEKSALDFNPDIIVCHVYRHPHTLKAINLAKKINKKCKVILVTHAPFVEGNSTRSFFSKLSVLFYDSVIGPLTINKFDKVIAITQWEIPYLKKLGIKKDKLVYIPNGIPEEFFQKKIKTGNNILFLGRISPIKKIETILKAIPFFKNDELKLDLIGPVEEDYKKILDKLIYDLKIKDRVSFLGPTYDLNKKINLVDNYKFFILSSEREAMPQALIEAMARGKIVLSSETEGGKEIIQNRKNGFLFKIGNFKELAELINKSENENLKQISENAFNTSKKFQWKNLIQNLNEVLCS